jgi:hypothetical protein
LTDEQSTASKVITSLHNDATDRCVDIFRRADGSFGYQEFRRDVEDQGAWFITHHNQDGIYLSYEEAIREARANVPWLGTDQGVHGEEDAD